ncbi:MAG: Mu transposase C-terminal domain-containing protein [Pseudomonadota bacterium]
MSRFIVTPADRLSMSGREWRLAASTGTGYVFEAADDPAITMGLSATEFSEHLKDPAVTFDRGWYDAGKTKARLDAPTECLRDLPKAVRSMTLWRWAYCDAFLLLEASGRVKRTEVSIRSNLAGLRDEVDAIDLARQLGTRKARAGQKSFVRKPPCPRSLLTWIRRYERSGRDPLSLVARTHRSGNRSKRFCLDGARLIAKAIAGYGTSRRPTIRQVATDCINSFATENKLREADGRPPIAAPSRRTIERRIEGLDRYATYAGRYGAAAANRKFAAIELGIKAGYPMERIEIDEWNVDLLTLLTEAGALDGMSDAQRRGLVRERLWLYVAIDCATRCVLAMRLSETPNSADAILTLADATRDKSDLAREAGCERTWHQHGGLGAVVTDHGAAFTSEAFRTALGDLGATAELPPVGIASLRGRVERLFGTFGTDLMARLAGRTFSNPLERGDYPSEELAVHSRETLLQVLTVYVVDIYHNRVHAGLGGETPANCWERLRGLRGTIPAPVPQLRCRVFGIELTRKVSRMGVTVLGNAYACQALRDMLRHSHDADVTLRVDPADLGWIMVRVAGRWHRAEALRSVMRGVGLAEWRLAVREMRLNHRREEALHEEQIARALRKIDDINAAQLSMLRVRLPYLTAEDLRREERQLGLGLHIDMDAVPDVHLPKAEDGFGHVVPLGEATPDLFSLGRSAGPNKAESPEGSFAAKPPPSDDWGLEED